MPSERYRKLTNTEYVTLPAWNVVCLACGSIVADRVLHDRYHDRCTGYCPSMCCALDDAESRASTAKGEAEELKRLLFLVTWAEDDDTCQICMGHKPGHYDDCEVGHALA